MAVAFWLKRPRMLASRLRYWVWERLNPDKPWLCPGTVRFCQNCLHSEMRALEFGSGRSTQWFSHLVGHLTSIEHDLKWYQQVSEQLRMRGASNVSYRHIPLDHDIHEGERESYDPTPRYVAAVDSFDDRSLQFVVIDGHYRTHCIRHAVPKIVEGGYLLVDDINLWPDPAALPVPKHWRIVDDSTNGIKRCIIWQAQRPS